MQVLTGAAAAAILGLAAWAPAQADPVDAKGAFSITVTCDNGMTYDAVSNGNGTFVPAPRHGQHRGPRPDPVR